MRSCLFPFIVGVASADFLRQNVFIAETDSFDYCQEANKYHTTDVYIGCVDNSGTSGYPTSFEIRCIDSVNADFVYYPSTDNCVGYAEAAPFAAPFGECSASGFSYSYLSAYSLKCEMGKYVYPPEAASTAQFNEKNATDYCPVSKGSTPTTVGSYVLNKCINSYGGNYEITCDYDSVNYAAYFNSSCLGAPLAYGKVESVGCKDTFSYSYQGISDTTCNQPTGSYLYSYSYFGASESDNSLHSLLSASRNHLNTIDELVKISVHKAANSPK